MTEQMAGQMSIFDLGLPFGKMSPAPIPQTEGAISKPSSKPSAKSQTPQFQFLSLKKESGLTQDASWEMATQLPGAPMMLNIGPGPHSAESASTLSQILVPNAPEKYFLSAKACQGILNRAKKRGKELPPMLKEALGEVIRLEA